MSEPSNRVALTADVAAGRDETFTYLTDHFDDVWAGSMKPLEDGTDPNEPRGLGFHREMRTPIGRLNERIVSHERPSLIEYEITNDGETRMHNHLGRIV